MVLIAIEHDGKGPRKSSLEALTVGRALADSVGTPAMAVVAGSDVDAVERAVAALGVPVLGLRGDDLSIPRTETMARALERAVAHTGARYVVAPATKFGLSYTPRLAVRLRCPLLEDVTSLRSEDERLIGTRLAYLSRVLETVEVETSPVVVSVKPGVAAVAEPGGAAGSIEHLDVSPDPTATRVEVVERRPMASGRIPLEDAEVVVVGGRGFGGAEAFGDHVVALADAIGAGVGATRAVVDAGWRPYAEQIGQTGRSVAPRLYFALGVSGAVQHLSGMNRSEVVVAVNKDPDAPIFRAADYGVVGDVFEIVPALTRALVGAE